MPMLIIGGDGPQVEEKTKKPMAMKPFKGIGGNFESEESDSGMEKAGAEGSSTDADNVRLFFESGKAGKWDRAVEALKALVQSCCESGE